MSFEHWLSLRLVNKSTICSSQAKTKIKKIKTPTKTAAGLLGRIYESLTLTISTIATMAVAEVENEEVGLTYLR